MTEKCEFCGNNSKNFKEFSWIHFSTKTYKICPDCYSDELYEVLKDLSLAKKYYLEAEEKFQKVLNLNRGKTYFRMYSQIRKLFLDFKDI